jgi:pyruvate/2-oxoglutarate dehydrogenase complex dihydrolipoamide acyltransferase (E2) component
MSPMKRIALLVPLAAAALLIGYGGKGQSSPPSRDRMPQPTANVPANPVTAAPESKAPPGRAQRRSETPHARGTADAHGVRIVGAGGDVREARRLVEGLLHQDASPKRGGEHSETTPGRVLGELVSPPEASQEPTGPPEDGSAGVIGQLLDQSRGGHP